MEEPNVYFTAFEPRGQLVKVVVRIHSGYIHKALATLGARKCFVRLPMNSGVMQSNKRFAWPP
jgi:hypothetical protein